MFNHAAAIGIDIGKNEINTAIIKMHGEIIASRTVPLTGSQSKDYLIDRLLFAIEEQRRSVAADGINPICIGTSAKGFIDHAAGVVLGPDQGIKDWKNVPLAKIINQASGLPAYIGNDANMMTIAEHRFGAAKGYNNIIFVALRTGIGGGIIINGKLYRGVNNAGGEVGQMIINFNASASDKGVKGSYEQFASASALVKRFNEENPDHYDDGSKAISVREIFELSYKGLPAAEKVVDENADLVGIGLANLISIFAPEIIVLGGGMAQARDSYLEKIRKSAFNNSLENCRSEVRIERAQLGPAASLLGSAYYSMIRLSGKNV
jgi:glucokinase